MTVGINLHLVITMALVIVGAIVLAYGLVYLVRYYRRTYEMRGTDDVEGIYVTALATLYGIFIAFMVFAVWTRFYDALESADREAAALTNVYRMAEALPEAYEDRMQQLALEYGRTMVRYEWPAMEAGRDSPESWDVVNRMWRLTSDIADDSSIDDPIQDHVLDQVIELTGLRRNRLLHASTSLPLVLDAVLILGAIIVIGFAAVFSVVQFPNHLIKTTALAVIVALMLFTVWELDHPYRGDVHVTPEAFERTLSILQEAR